MIQFDEHIFQMGWFNHQVEINPQKTELFYKRDTWKSISPKNPGPALRVGLTVSIPSPE